MFAPATDFRDAGFVRVLAILAAILFVVGDHTRTTIVRAFLAVNFVCHVFLPLLDSNVNARGRNVGVFKGKFPMRARWSQVGKDSFTRLQF